MSSIEETRICVQKMLPHHQREYDKLLSSSRSPDHMQRLSAAFFTKKLWPKDTTISIAFLGTGKGVKRSDVPTDGSIPVDPLQKEVANMSVQQAIKKIVRERIQPLVNLKLEFVEKPSAAHVRIGFDPNGGAWSLVGTDALHEPSKPTMNFGWFDVATTMHEFGHMLGMIHEHQNPRGQSIKWDDAKVFQWAKDTQGWSEKVTEQNIIKKYNMNDINGSNFDPLSVMLYFFPGKLTTNNKGTHQNLRLSGEDVMWINKMYPTTGGITPSAYYEKIYGESLENSTDESKRLADGDGKLSFITNFSFRNIMTVMLAAVLVIILLFGIRKLWLHKKANITSQRYR